MMSQTKKILLGFLAIISVGPANAETLVKAYGDALKNDAIYLQAQSQYMADKQATRAAWSVFFPQISATGDLLSNHTDNDISGFAVNAQQTIFNWSAIKHVSKAKAQVRVAVLTLTAAQQDLMSRVTSRYLNVVQAHETYLLTQNQVRSVKKQMNAVNERYKVGHATVTDMDRVKASYDLYRSQMVTAKIQQNDAEQELAELTGVAYKNTSTFKAKFVLLFPQPKKLDLWLSRVKSQNLNLLAATEGVAVAKAALGEAKGGYLPNISANSSYYPTEPAYDDQHFLYSLSVDYNAFQGGATGAAVSESAAMYQKAQEQRDGVYKNAIMQASNAYSSVINGVDQLTAELRAVQSNQSALDHTKEGYNAGSQTLLDVLDQQTNLYNAKMQYVEGRVQYLGAIAMLEQQAGTLKVKTLVGLQRWLQ